MEPFDNIAAHSFTKVFQAGKVKSAHSCKLQFQKISVKVLFQFPAGSSADHGNIHGNQITDKGGIAAFVNGVPEPFIGFLPNPSISAI